MKPSELLKKLLENPDDLTELPGLIDKVSEIEKNEENYQSRIANLQEVNRKYLQMIPMEGKEPPKEDKPVDYRQDSKAYLEGLMNPKGE